MTALPNTFTSFSGLPIHATDYRELNAQQFLFLLKHNMINPSLLDSIDSLPSETLAYCDERGRSLLHFSAGFQNLEVTQRLILFGLDPKQMDVQGRTPVMEACLVGSLALVDFFCSLPLNLAGQRDRRGRTLMHLAASKGFCDIITYLSENFDDQVNAEDHCKIRPITEAFYNTHPRVYELLYQRGGRDSNWMQSDVSCPVCMELYSKPVNLNCGHTFCRSCLQACRQRCNKCPLCREEILLLDGHEYDTILEKVIQHLFPNKRTGLSDPRKRAMENAVANLKCFGDSLGIVLLFNEKNSCSLKIDNDFPIHLTFLWEKSTLFAYSPLAEEIPQNPVLRHRIFERLLKGAHKGKQMSGGGIGIIQEGQLILYHIELDLTNAAASALKRASIPYVETVKYWRQQIKNILMSGIPDDRQVPEHTLPPSPPPLKMSDSSDVEMTDQESTEVQTAKSKLGRFSGRGKRTKLSTSSEEDSVPVTKRIMDLVDPSEAGNSSSSNAPTRESLTKSENENEEQRKKLLSSDPLKETLFEGIKVYYKFERSRAILFSVISDDISLRPTSSQLELFEKILQRSTFGTLVPKGGVGLDVNNRLTVYRYLRYEKKDHLFSDSLQQHLPEFKEVVDRCAQLLA